MYSVATCNENI